MTAEQMITRVAGTLLSSAEADRDVDLSECQGAFVVIFDGEGRAKVSFHFDEGTSALVASQVLLSTGVEFFKQVTQQIRTTPTAA